MAFFLEHQSELAGSRCLTGALQADKHDDRHAGGGQSDLALCPAQKLSQLVFDDLDDRLVRLQAAKDLFPHRLFTDVSDEIFRHLEIDIGFQQCAADLTKRPINVTFGKLALPAEILERRLQLVS